MITSLVAILLVEHDSEAQEREQLRYDRHKERERQRRLAKAHPDKRSKLDREKDRDVTEKIALGMPSKTATQESMFDQRLFNQSQVSSDFDVSEAPRLLRPNYDSKKIIL